MTSYLFTNLRLLDPARGELLGGMEVLVEGDRIKEVSDRPIHSDAAQRVDLGGRTLMPGLIDAHVHVVASMVNLAANSELPDSLATLRATKVMTGMLMRGFTTVRDLGGADLGLALAVEDGLFDGPRLVQCGKSLGQTGGHSDKRSRFDHRLPEVRRAGALGRVVDGVEGIRLAAREEIKAGAQFIKIMANGGVASPNDPIHALGFSRDEIRTAVEEASNAGTYVAAHLYTDEAIRRAVECGVHSLEHCNLIQTPTAELAVKAGAVAIPTLAAYEGLAREGAALGLRPESVAKIETVRRGGLESLDIMWRAGLPMAYGSDLLGGLHKYQSLEFEMRARVLPVRDIIASATLVGARLCGLEGQVGVVAPDAWADLLVVDGDPFADIGLLQHDGAHFAAIIRGGRFITNRLG
ncbi:Amidohydrolase family protein [Rhodovastum atsumiense]|uniref:Amidohydrolase family protein n=1 Tax=Rhodovastum atsumiense TaxID=504468 RepID=A0A5M6J366_9PROT|nr:amidohydrolase family protein [Rhodovastum atsumiense]KAA5614095.1 amidohydrolase family protein [Rhodovastum atsumiense]CAH2598925.1 Amidohydrolase family protein [Rhodovastum atsumiense]